MNVNRKAEEGDAFQVRFDRDAMLRSLEYLSHSLEMSQPVEAES